MRFVSRWSWLVAPIVAAGLLMVGGMVLTQIIRQIRLFLMPPMLAATNRQEFEEMWPAGGP